MPLRIFKDFSGRRPTDAPPGPVPPRDVPPGAQPQQLRPLLLVARQEARALENAARRTGSADADSMAPLPQSCGVSPGPALPQLFTGPPPMGQRSARTLAPSEPPRSQGARQANYNVNDRIERARALRAQSAAAPPHNVAPVRPVPSRGPGSYSELPYLRDGKAPKDQHQLAIEEMRKAGHVLPNLLRQAERGQPLMVPPRQSSRTPSTQEKKIR